MSRRFSGSNRDSACHYDTQHTNSSPELPQDGNACQQFGIAAGIEAELYLMRKNCTKACQQHTGNQSELTKAASAERPALRIKKACACGAMYIPSGPSGRITSATLAICRIHIQTHEEGAAEELLKLCETRKNSYVVAPFPWDGTAGEQQPMMELEKLGELHHQWAEVELHSDKLLPTALQVQITQKSDEKRHTRKKGSEYDPKDISIKGRKDDSKPDDNAGADSPSKSQKLEARSPPQKRRATRQHESGHKLATTTPQHPQPTAI